MAACALVLLVLGCGSGDGNAAPDPDRAAGGPAGEQREADRHPGGAAGRAARAHRQLRPAALRDRAAGRPAARLRRRAGRAHLGRARRAQAGRAVPRPELARPRPAASRACCRWRSRPTTRPAGSSTSTTPTIAGDSRIVEYKRASDDRADPGSARQVIFQRQPEPNHNGGLLLFGPDEQLYVGFGDGGGGRRPARLARQRAEPRHAARQDPAHRPARRPAAGPTAIPSSNPFVEPPRRARRDLRLRAAQPVALLVRPLHGRPDDRRRRARTQWEEIDFVRRDRGQGRELRLARRSRAARTTTRTSRRPGRSRRCSCARTPTGWCSITGGVVVRDPALAGLLGRYVFGDYCRAQIRLGPPRLRLGARRALDRPEGVRADVVRRGRAGPRVRDLGRTGRSTGSPRAEMPTLADFDVACVRADERLGVHARRHEHLDPRPRPGVGDRSRPGSRRARRRRRAGRGRGARRRRRDRGHARHSDHVEGLIALRERLGCPPVARVPQPRRRHARATASEFGPLRAYLVPGHAADHLVYVAGHGLLHRRRGARRGQRLRGARRRRARRPTSTACGA